MYYINNLIRPKEFLAELLGTFVMVIIAKSAGVSLAVLSARNDPAATGSLLTGGLSAGLGVMVGILVTGNASGAHMNPCVSVAMAIWGRLKFSALPSYILGQFLGAAAGSALVLFLFYDTIVEVGPEVMTSYPGLAEGEVQLSFDQGVATFILLLVVCSVEDQGHTPPALLVGLSVATITITMGANAGASMNPAVDFMPRAIAALWRMSLSPFHKGGKFWLIPFLVPYLGAAIGVSVYSLAIQRVGQESIVTKKTKSVQFITS
eukprot:TRINITY_DN6102_c0_g1_i3.p1 TRINITY_DN6102_c0_g1~~TRINITY_DN6102_c0_g1_i3.p1  ORF type:complete len:263 (-),score=61.78 TRINITY_DN6102_c0_g1_i3:81-869(-)